MTTASIEYDETGYPYVTEGAGDGDIVLDAEGFPYIASTDSTVEVDWNTDDPYLIGPGMGRTPAVENAKGYVRSNRRSKSADRFLPRTTETTVKRGDTGPALVVYLYDEDTPVDLTAALAVRVVGTRQGLLAVDGLAKVTNAAAGEITYRWSKDDTSLAGELLVEIEVSWQDGSVQTFPGSGWLRVTVKTDL